MGSKKKGHRADPQASTSGPTDAFTTPGMAKLGCSLIVPPGARFKLMTGRIDARTVVDKVFPNRTREIQYPGGTVWVLEQSEGAGLPHVHVLAGAVQVDNISARKLRLEFDGTGDAAKWPDGRAVLQCPSCAASLKPGSPGVMTLHLLLSEAHAPAQVAIAMRLQPRLWCLRCFEALWATGIDFLNDAPALPAFLDAEYGPPVPAIDRVHQLQGDGTFAAVQQECGAKLLGPLGAREVRAASRAPEPTPEELLRRLERCATTDADGRALLDVTTLPPELKAALGLPQESFEGRAALDWATEAGAMRDAAVLIAEAAGAAAPGDPPADCLFEQHLLYNRLVALFDLEQGAVRATGRPQGHRQFVLRKVAEDGVPGQLLQASVRCAAAMRKSRNADVSSEGSSSRPTESAGTDHALFTQLSHLSAMIHLLCNLVDVPKVATELAQHADVVPLLEAAVLNAREAPASTPQTAKDLCNLACPLVNALPWAQLERLVLRTGVLRGVYETCIESKVENADAPGAPTAFALRLFGGVLNRTYKTRGDSGADPGVLQQADAILAAVAELPVFEGAMAVLAHNNVWRTIHPAHAFDFVSAGIAMMLLGLPGGSWGRLQSHAQQRKAIEATLRGLMRRSWPRALNMLGNVIGPQIVEESEFVLEQMVAIGCGMPCPDLLDVMARQGGDTLAHTRKLLKRAEVRMCATCAAPETDRRLSKCARCQVALYCSPECQRRDWKEGHKQSCKPVCK